MTTPKWLEEMAEKHEITDFVGFEKHTRKLSEEERELFIAGATAVLERVKDESNDVEAYEAWKRDYDQLR